MATIRKRSKKWNVQIRRFDHPPLSKTFISKSDAIQWATKTEALLDRGGSVLSDINDKLLTLGGLLRMYRDKVVVHKRSASYETIMINAFLRQDIVELKLSEVKPHHFSNYRD